MFPAAGEVDSLRLSPDYIHGQKGMCSALRVERFAPSRDYLLGSIRMLVIGQDPIQLNHPRQGTRPGQSSSLTGREFISVSTKTQGGNSKARSPSREEEGTVVEVDEVFYCHTGSGFLDNEVQEAICTRAASWRAHKSKHPNSSERPRLFQTHKIST